MNSSFTKLLIVSAALALASLASSAQGLPTHPDDPTARRIDTISVTLDLPSSTMTSPTASFMAGHASPGPGPSPSSQSVNNCELRSLVIVWHTSVGRAEYTIDPASIRGTGSAIDSYTTSALLEMIARAAVITGIAEGYTPCGGSVGAQSVVYRNSCIQRTGSGSATRFIACDNMAFCRYAFAASCSTNGTMPTLTDLPVANRCNGATVGIDTATMD